MNRYALWCTLLAVGCSGTSPASSTDMGFGSVNIFSWWSGAGEADALRAVLELYQRQYPGTSLENSAVVGSGTQDQDVAKSLARGEIPPDAFQLAGNGGEIDAWTHFSGTLADPISPSVNALMPLDDLYAEGNWLSLMPKIITDVLRGDDGHMYMVPIGIHRRNSLFYNTALFRTCPKVGGGALTAPVSWSEYLEVTVPSLEACKITPLALSGQGWAQHILWLNVLIGTAGAPYRNRLETGLADFGSESTADAQTLKSSLRTLYNVLWHVNLDATSAFGWDDAAALLQSTSSNRAAMYIHGDWAKGYYQASGWHAGVDFDELPGPGTAGTYLFNYDAFAIPQKAKNIAAAKAFISVFASKEGQVAFNTLKGSAPVRNDIALASFDTVEQQKIAQLQDPATTLLSLSDSPADWANETACLIPAFRPTAPPPSDHKAAETQATTQVDAIYSRLAACYLCDIKGICGAAQAGCFHVKKACQP